MAEIKQFLSQEAKSEIDFYLSSLGEMSREYKDLSKAADSFTKIVDKAKDIEAQTNGISVSTKKLSTELTSYQAIAKESEKVNKQLITTEAKLKVQYTEQGKTLARNRLAIQQRSKVLKDEARLEDAAADSVVNMRVQLSRLNKQYDEGDAALRKKLLPSIQKLDTELKELEGTTGRNQRNVGNYGSALNRLNPLIDIAQGGFKGLKELAIGLGKGLKFLVATPLGLLITGFTLLASVVGKSLKVNKEFEQSLASLSAITGASGKNLDFFAKKAIQYSQATLTSANDFIAAFEKVGSIRPELLKDGEALAEVTFQAVKLSESTGGKLPLEDAAKSLTFTLNAFKIESKDAAKAVDVLAAGSKEGSATVDQLSETFKNFGSVAADSNLTLQQAVALTETVAKEQIVGAEAGTKLRGVLLKLKQAGIGYAEGQFNVNNALNELKLELEGIENPLERDQRLIKVFGAENINTGTILLNNIGLFNKLTVAVDKNGVALEQQIRQNDTLAGRQKQLKNAWDNLFLSVTSGRSVFSSFAKSGLEVIIAKLNSLNEAFIKVGAIWRTTKKLFAGDIKLGNFREELQKEVDTTYESIAAKEEEKAATIAAEAEKAEAIKKYNEEKEESERKTKAEKERLDREEKEREKEAEKEALAIVKNTSDEAIAQRQRELTANLNILEIRKKAGLLAEEQYQNEVAKLRDEAVQDEINRLQTLLDVTDIKESERLAIQTKINDAIAKQREIEAERRLKQTQAAIEPIRKNAQEEVTISADTVEKNVANAERQKELKKSISDQEKENTIAVYEAIGEASSMLNQAIFDQVQAKYDKQLSVIEENTEAELNKLEEKRNRGLITEEQFESGKLKIEEKAKKESAKIKRKQAIANKTAAIIDIAINTAVAVSKALAQTGVLAPATIPIIVGLGLLQAGIVAAKPIPEFAKGTKSSPDTFIAGEKGRELMVTPQGSVIMADAPTLYSGLKGTQVFSNRETERMIASAGKDMSSSDERLLNEVRNLNHTIKNKREVYFNFKKRTITDRQGNYYKTYKNRLVN